jgi:hypothetical protein
MKIYMQNLLQTKFKGGFQTFKDRLKNSGAFELCRFSLFVVYEARKRPRDWLQQNAHMSNVKTLASIQTEV